MENYKQINKQLIEQNREMRLRIAQEREQSTALCTQLLEERTLRVELQHKLVQLHTKVFREIVAEINPEASILQLFCDRDDNGSQAASSRGRRSSSPAPTSGDGSQRRSSERRRSSNGSSRRSSLEMQQRYGSILELPTSPTLARYSLRNRPVTPNDACAAHEDEELLGGKNENAKTTYLDESIAEEVEPSDAREQEPESESEDREGSVETDDSDEDDEEFQPEADTDIDTEQEVVATPPTPLAVIDEGDEDLMNMRQLRRRNARNPSIMVLQPSPLRDLTNCSSQSPFRGAYVTRRGNKKGDNPASGNSSSCCSLNESIAQPRFEQSMRSSKDSHRTLLLEPNLIDDSKRELPTDVENSSNIDDLTMNNLLSSTPYSAQTRKSNANSQSEQVDGLVSQLRNTFLSRINQQHQQQQLTISSRTAESTTLIGTTVIGCTSGDFTNTSATMRPRRRCAPTTLAETSLKQKMRNESTTKKKTARK